MTTTPVRHGFAVGSLVTARGRDWVVLPGSDQDMLVLRPLGGGTDDIAGVLPAVERVDPATFAPPLPTDLGDDRSARLLRDALRIGFRASSGPFRSLAGLGVTPRPYQFVPLLLALRQETVRLLIADDVGIGKTVEAGLVAAELLQQGSAQRLTVLCPPSLATQWETELREKFGLDPVLVLPSTIRGLERNLTGDESVFTRHQVTVVSTDFVKSPARRFDFARTAADLVIVDEAHGSVSDDSTSSSGRSQRYQLIRSLADDPTRHLILVTATPHSGKEGAFRNLIGLLDEDLATADLTTVTARERLAQHMVQRRRADIRSFLAEDTVFPKDRQVSEHAYRLSPAHRDLFDNVLRYVRAKVQDRSGTTLEQRVRWWSALSLLRSVGSSPAAAAATLSTRAATLGASHTDAADDLGRAEVLDLVEDHALDTADATPGAIDNEHTRSEESALAQLRRQVDALLAAPAQDAKLNLLTREVKKLLADGYHPIVFCRFIPTAHYVTEALRRALPKAQVEVVTGEHPADERAARVAGLVEAAASGPKVLVATDCLSEGVNLQQDFQAVVHYDLAWNPTRHEQREGRVDRFGQPKDVVRAMLIYGEDTGIDGIILDVLIRKHAAIRRDLGVSVPVPAESDGLLAALLEGVLMRGREADQLTLDFTTPAADALENQWRSTAETEKASRTKFAQQTIKAAEVGEVVEASRASLGRPNDVAGFVRSALVQLGATILAEDAGGFTADVSTLPVGLRNMWRDGPDELRFVNDLPAPAGAAVLTRTDPTVTALARFVLDGALDSTLEGWLRPARRCGLVVTDAVDELTTVLLVRVRTHLALPGREGTRNLVAEDARVVAFTGRPATPTWLGPEQVEQVLAAQPTANLPTDVMTNAMGQILRALPALDGALNELGQSAADELLAQHQSVRLAARGSDRAGQTTTRGLKVTPQLPVDVLGVYVYRPAGVTR